MFIGFGGQRSAHADTLGLDAGFDLCSDAQLGLNVRRIRLVHQTRLRQVALLLCALFSQDVRLERMLALQLSRSGHGEALLRATLGLHLRHVVRIWRFRFPVPNFFTFSGGV